MFYNSTWEDNESESELVVVVGGPRFVLSRIVGMELGLCICTNSSSALDRKFP